MFLRQQKYRLFSKQRIQMNFYGCSERDAFSLMPAEWTIYKNRHGITHPAEEKFYRIIMGKEVISLSSPCY
jgi:hypothetical protein